MRDEKAPRRIKAILKGKKGVRSLSPKGFEEAFKVRYSPRLLFRSKREFKELQAECPLLLKWTWLGGRCRDLASAYRDELSCGFVESLVIAWIDPSIGYGLFAGRPLQADAYLGEYTGVLTRSSRRRPDKNPYCMHYPTRWWSRRYWMVDAERAGNEMRFANHSSSPNCRVDCLLEDNLLHFVFFSDRAIPLGEELTIDYGPDFRF